MQTCMARRGQAGHGGARPGPAGQGMGTTASVGFIAVRRTPHVVAWRGMAGHGEARLGRARQGKAGQGKAWATPTTPLAER